MALAPERPATVRRSAVLLRGRPRLGGTMDTPRAKKLIARFFAILKQERRVIATRDPTLDCRPCRSPAEGTSSSDRELWTKRESARLRMHLEAA
jgi:hypothetical protein